MLAIHINQAHEFTVGTIKALMKYRTLTTCRVARQ
jgi:hypothetical protein